MSKPKLRALTERAEAEAIALSIPKLGVEERLLYTYPGSTLIIQKRN